MWTPIVPKAAVEERLTAIARTLTQHRDVAPDEAGLLVGRAGIALFFLHYARFTGNPADTEHSESFLQRLFESLPATLPFTFCSGLAGIAWLLRYASGDGLIDANADEALSDADALILDRTVSEMREGRFDFLHGALGGALYLLESAGRGDAQDALREVLTALEHQATVPGTADEVAWSNNLAGMDEDKGSFNLGLAHGMPSIISLLARFVSHGVEPDRSAALLDRAVAFVLAHRLAAPGGANFPARTGDGGSRLAWCYGDPGVAAALWQAARVRQREDWRRTAIEVLEHAAAQRAESETGVQDACLCHGSAGLALIFARMGHEAGNQTLRDASVHWVGDTLARGGEGNGYAGYLSFVADRPREIQLELSVLNGIAGIGLALIAAASAVEPTWDRALLLS